MRINETPTTVSVLPPDPVAAAKAFREELEKVVAAIEKADGVMRERAEFEQSERRYASLVAARDGLNLRARQLVTNAIAANDRVETGLLAQFSEDGATTDVSALIKDVLHEQAEASAVSRVISRLVEHLIPCGLVVKLRLESRLRWARAAEVERIASARFQRTTELLRSATEFEGAVTMDVRTTLSGALLAFAAELRNKAFKLSAVSRPKRTAIPQPGR